MKIKNIQQYRTYFKEFRQSSTRDEHFVGNSYIEENTNEKKLGWFEIYHGYKEGYGSPIEGIENFLESFLDMAKDGQAVYEFLQNAVDAASSHFTMIWGKDEIDGNHYLLVANNGQMFNEQNIESILNVGSSTKTSDSRTIGKFGIGFKLAHRLVGKNNGLQELIHENSGPILFSWKNYEIAELAEESHVEPEDFRKNSPWLFKILITCFPCLPENEIVTEIPRMANGKMPEKCLFSKSEYQALARTIKPHLNILSKEIYNEGSLFFLKLGAGKINDLEEINLSEGVKFALAILEQTSNRNENTILKTVQINDKKIEYPELEYIKFIIDKEKEKNTYAHIRFGITSFEELTPEQQNIISKEADIEILFGFRKNNEIGDYFKGAPNLYLYFPLSEEVHNFNYVLHSNAFYKGSSRTFLHKGTEKEGGINERLLSIIVQKIDCKLKELSDSSNIVDRDMFLHLYAALLTSGKSVSKERLWIEEPYINSVNELLRKYIPVRKTRSSNEFEVTNDIDHVYIKDTEVDIDIENWGLKSVKWFYWEGEHNQMLLKNSEDKLAIARFNISSLLSYNENIPIRLNEWIDNNTQRTRVLLKEISNIEDAQIKEIISNLMKIKIFEFSNGEWFTINMFIEKEQTGYFIIHNKLNEIRDLFYKLGLVYTVEDFDCFQKIFSYFNNDSQVRNYLALTKLFSKVVENDKLLLLNNNEKYKIFEAFRTLNDSPGDRLSELKLLPNNRNQIIPFRNLYIQSDIEWLHSFCLNTKIDLTIYENYRRYLLNKPEQLYQGIINPFWKEIVSYLAINKDKSKDIFKSIETAFEKSDWAEKSGNLLKDFIVFQNQVIDESSIYFNAQLLELTEEQYENMQIISSEYYGIYIPDKFFAAHIHKTHFEYDIVSFGPLENLSIPLIKLEDLILLAEKTDNNFFAENIISFDGINFITNQDTKKSQIATTKDLIIDYINNYHSLEYEVLQNKLIRYEKQVKLSGGYLIDHLVDSFTEADEDNLQQELDFIKLVLTEGTPDNKKTLLGKLTYVNLDAKWDDPKQNSLYLKLLSDVVENIGTENIANIHSKIRLIKDNIEVSMADIESANDSIEVKRGDKVIILSQTQILNLENHNIELVQDFFNRIKNEDIISGKTAEKLFKISKSGITDELLIKFINSLQNNTIINAHQLVFLLFSGKIDSQDYNKYSLLSYDDKSYKLEGQLICFSAENIRFIDPMYLLHESFSDLKELLQLGSNEYLKYNEYNDVIASRFVFSQGFTPEILRSDESILDKLDYLYEGYKGIPQPQEMRDENWKDFLGIIPQNFIINGIQIEEEKLPPEFIKWSDSDRNKVKFFQYVGVYVGDSPVEKLRKCLLGKIDVFEECNWKGISKFLLLNTLTGLSHSFKNEKSVSFTYEECLKIQLIEDIIEHILHENIEIPRIIYDTTDSFILSLYKKDFFLFDEKLHQELKMLTNNKLNELYKQISIVKQPFRENKLEDSIDELIADLYFIKQDVQENSEPFYPAWSKENNIKLFRVNLINYRVLVNIEEEFELGLVERGSFYIEETDEEVIIYYTCSSLDELKNKLSDKDQEFADKLEILIERRDSLLKSFYNTLSVAGDDETNKILQAAIQEQQLKEDRERLASTLQEEQRYSYKWFKSYLEILKTYSEKGNQQQQKSLSFQEIKRYSIDNQVSEKYFLLCGASSYIPSSIEDGEDFKVTLKIKNCKDENITVEGASKQGQDLLIYCPMTLSQQIISQFSNVLRIEINFIPTIDLLDRLYRAFCNHDNIANEWEEIKKVIPALHYIYGPPGTGKTTALCNTINSILSERPDANFLVLTPTNKAADVVCKRLLCNFSSYMNITRLGSPTDPELEDIDASVYKQSLNYEELSNISVVASTIHRLPYFEINGDQDNLTSRLFKHKWDYVIFDESSMIGLHYMVFSIMALNKTNPDAHFIIAGDPKQIPPVVEVNDKDLEEFDFQDENIYKMMGLNSFKPEEQIIRENDEINNLRTQYRSVKQIGQLFSELSYQKLLKHDREINRKESKLLPENLKKLISSNVTFIDIPLNQDNSIYKINKLLYSSYQTYSAILVAEIIKYFDRTNTEEQWTIGLIAPYKAQAILLNKLITSYGISENLKIYADTVHGFQGDECDIVFFVCNPNQYYYTGNSKCLLSKEYIYNVAISRAKDYLIILHPYFTIENNYFIDHISQSYRKNFGVSIIKQASEIEKILFKGKSFKESFIAEYSYTTGHDNINVFGLSDMEYFIKLNDNAIDIQLKK